MLEPIVQDYVRAAVELSRSSFCKRFEAPVLVSREVKQGFAFQQDTTAMHGSVLPMKAQRAKSGLSHQLPVIELRKDRPGSVDQFNVGRLEENDLVILDETVSGRHAVLFMHRSGSAMIEDLGSTNGTTVNNTLLVQGRAVELRDGDVIGFGESEYTFYSPGGLYDAIKSSVRSPSR